MEPVSDRSSFSSLVSAGRMCLPDGCLLATLDLLSPHSAYRHNASRRRAGAGGVVHTKLTDEPPPPYQRIANRLDGVVGDRVCVARCNLGAELLVERVHQMLRSIADHCRRIISGSDMCFSSCPVCPTALEDICAQRSRTHHRNHIGTSFQIGQLSASFFGRQMDSLEGRSRAEGIRHFRTLLAHGSSDLHIVRRTLDSLVEAVQSEDDTHRHHAHRRSAGTCHLLNEMKTDGTNQSSSWPANRRERGVWDTLCAADRIVDAELRAD
jgi:hypothetical protein